ncbi:MAG: hypothetical protein SNJ82_10585 [Gemmataceae bacterium]
MRRPLLLVCCALALLLVLALPVEAGWRDWLSGFANRSRVIQICIAVMLLALFIMLKKFVDR